jgi:two-component system response regulator
MAKRTILLVEDNPDDETLVLRAFTKNKLADEVVVVRDGAEALDYVFARGNYANRDAAAQPQVVLLDLKLPKVDGMEVLRQLRAAPETKLLPVVLLTSSNEEQDRLLGYALGANSFVRKPSHFIEFVDAVRMLGHYWLVLNEEVPASRRDSVRGELFEVPST